MKRPIVVIAVGYIIGIVWGLYCNCSIALLYAVILPIGIIINYLYKQKNKFKLFSIKRYLRYIKILLNQNVMAVIVISSIFSNTIIIQQNKKYDNLYNGISNVTLIGIVVSNPREKDLNNVYKLKVEKVNENRIFKNTYLFINIKRKDNVAIDYGDQIEIQGNFIHPTIQRNYKCFNYKEFLKSQKVYGTVNANKVVIKNRQMLNSISIASNKIFLRIKNNVEKAFPSKMANLFLAIILGYTDNLDDKIEQDFRDSNMAHVLAVSGMHITYIMSGLMLISKKLIIGKRKSKIIISIILIVYVFIAGFTPSSVRATVMGLLYLGRGIFYRKTDVWTSIAFSLLLILVYNPFLLENMSVLLSYGGTIGIILFNKRIVQMLEKVKIKDKKNKYKILTKFKRTAKFVKSSISIGGAVQIFIIPIYIYCFNTINLSIIITYLAISVVIGPIIVIGFLTLVCSLISTDILKIISLVLNPLLNILILISEIGTKLPLHKLYIGTPSILEITTYYLIILGLNFIYKVYNKKILTAFEYRIRNIISLIKYKIKQKKENIIAISLIFCIFISFLVIFPKDLKIYFIDVGQGDSTLIVTPMNKSILIDGGGSLNKSFDVGKSTLLPYLLDRRITKLDYIFISHFDQDHVGGLFTVMEELKVETIVIGKQGENSENYQKFKEIVKKNNINVTIVGQGDRLIIEKNIYFDILWPNNSNIIYESVLNNNSIVCKLHYNNFSMLFTGDIEKVAEKNILHEENKNLNSTILKVGHHGSDSSSIEEFIEAVKPKIALIGVGENNKFGHPNISVLERLEKNGAKIYRTDQMGEISIKVNSKGIIKTKKFIK